MFKRFFKAAVLSAASLFASYSSANPLFLTANSLFSSQLSATQPFEFAYTLVKDVRVVVVGFADTTLTQISEYFRSPSSSQLPGTYLFPYGYTSSDGVVHSNSIYATNIQDALGSMVSPKVNPDAVACSNCVMRIAYVNKNTGALAYYLDYKDPAFTQILQWYLSVADKPALQYDSGYSNIRFDVPLAILNKYYTDTTVGPATSAALLYAHTPSQNTTCKPGEFTSTVAGKTSACASTSPYAEDGVCVISNDGTASPLTDLDCLSVLDESNYKVGKTADGEIYTTLTNPAGGSLTVVKHKDGSATFYRTSVNSDGTYSRESIKYDRLGRADPLSYKSELGTKAFESYPGAANSKPINYTPGSREDERPNIGDTCSDSSASDVLDRLYSFLTFSSECDNGDKAEYDLSKIGVIGNDLSPVHRYFVPAVFDSTYFDFESQVSCTAAFDELSIHGTLPILNVELDAAMAPFCDHITPHEPNIMEIMSIAWILLASLHFIRLTV